MTIGDLLTRNANKFPEKPAVVDEGGSLTFQALNERVNRVARFLIGAGLKKGDRIGAVVHNGHQFMEIYFAAAKTGGIFCPYNNHLKSEELKELIDYSNPAFLFLDQDFGEMVETIRPGLSPSIKYICLQECKWPGMEQHEHIASVGVAVSPA